MRVFVAGAPCSGKSTLTRHLRETYRLNAVDLDDEIVRINGGSYPDIDTKNEVVFPQVIEALLNSPDTIAFHSYMPADDLSRLREAGFGVLIIDVSPDELRRRDAVRHAEEGWTNIKWFDWNQDALRELHESGHVDAVIPGERPIAAIAADIVDFARGG